LINQPCKYWAWHKQQPVLSEAALRLAVGSLFLQLHEEHQALAPKSERDIQKKTLQR